MHNLIYRNKEHAFNGLIYDHVLAYDANKLKFNTREEYLDWVKQWKEDMKIITHKHTLGCRTWKRDVCIRKDKIEKYQKLVDRMPKLTEEQNARYNARMNMFLADYELKNWFSSSLYLIWYMLIIRFAAKRKAADKRKERLQQESSVIA